MIAVADMLSLPSNKSIEMMFRVILGFPVLFVPLAPLRLGVKIHLGIDRLTQRRRVAKLRKENHPAPNAAATRWFAHLPSCVTHDGPTTSSFMSMCSSP